MEEQPLAELFPLLDRILLPALSKSLDALAHNNAKASFLSAIPLNQCLCTRTTPKDLISHRRP